MWQEHSPGPQRRLLVRKVLPQCLSNNFEYPSITSEWWDTEIKIYVVGYVLLCASFFYGVASRTPCLYFFSWRTHTPPLNHGDSFHLKTCSPLFWDESYMKNKHSHSPLRKCPMPCQYCDNNIPWNDEYLSSKLPAMSYWYVIRIPRKHKEVTVVLTYRSS